MAQWQGKSRKKPSGGVRIWARKKRKYEIGREVILPTLADEDHAESVRTRGGNSKQTLHRVGVANVTDPGSGETRRADISTVVDNPANPHYIRRNIVTKGAVVETDLGKARVTSRPGQHGVVNAVLLEPGEVVEPTPVPEEDEEPEPEAPADDETEGAEEEPEDEEPEAEADVPDEEEDVEAEPEPAEVEEPEPAEVDEADDEAEPAPADAEAEADEAPSDEDEDA